MSASLTPADIAKVDVNQWVDENLAIRSLTSYPPGYEVQDDTTDLLIAAGKVKSFEVMMLELKAIRPTHELGSK